MRKFTLAFIFVCLASPMSFAQTVVRTPITAAEKQKVDAFISGRNLLRVNNYVSPLLDSIGPVEHVIFRRALLLGGLDAVFEDDVVPNSARARQEIRNASVVGGGAGQWHYYLAENPADVLESDPVILLGEYEKGLYTTLEKAGKLKIETLADLKTLSAVTSNAWVIDWATLSRLPLKSLLSAPTRPAQFRMVKGARADFTIQDFAATRDMSIEEEEGIRLYPLRGVKIVLSGTRHYFISKNHPDGPKVFEALQRGLRIMRQSGEIRRAFTESGVFHKDVKSWTVLNAS